MGHVGVGNRTDHARPTRTATRVQNILEKHDPRFGVHAMVGGQGDYGSRLGQLTARPVKRGIERVRFRTPRRLFMLDIVAQRKIHQVRPLLFEQGEAGFQNKE